jgi:hypothetical protein
MRDDPDLPPGAKGTHGSAEGRYRQRSAAIDHAAAPLGIDEEAAGTPVSKESIAAARRYERRRHSGIVARMKIAVHLSAPPVENVLIAVS